MEIFPILYTERLVLRKLTADDIPLLVKYANDREVAENVLNMPHPFQKPDAVFRIRYVVQGFKDGLRYVFAIALHETSHLIGEIAIHVDPQHKTGQLAYWIAEPHRASGFATEAARAVINFGFKQLHLANVFAECHTHNNASRKVLEKAGMTKAGVNGSILRFESLMPRLDLDEIQP
jgi:[ribosomal protein S5]-alanine N-acetyltransferase